MSDQQWGAVSLIAIGLTITGVFLANWNIPGDMWVPGRKTKPTAYWGNVIFFGGASLLGLYGLTIGF